jgi:Xaa-Pro aminopeptidase
MSVHFDPEFFTRNRARLRGLFPDKSLIILTANGILQRSADNPFAFHQDPSFWYFAGTTEPDLILVMDHDEDYLILPGRSDFHDLFDGALDRDGLKQSTGIGTLYDEEEGWKKLAKPLKKLGKAHTVTAPPQYLEPYGFYPNPARARLETRLREVSPKVEFTDIREQIANLRIIKQAVEIDAIQEAVDVTVEGIKYVTESWRGVSYEYEYEIEADLSREFRRTGAGGHAFSPIIAGGLRACTIHNQSNQAKLDHEELVLLDVGAAVGMYNADISRTISLGKPTKRQKAVHDAVVDAQEYGISLLKPGVSFKDCELEVRKFMGKKLKELKLINSAEDEEEIRKYYPHAPHYLGLDVHDAGDYKRPLEAGMVLTVEPGIYIPEESLGVRIEDDILITKDGCSILSEKLPKRLG